MYTKGLKLTFLLLALFTIASADDISPVLERVVNNCNGTFTAWFGYNNPNAQSVDIQIGADNHFSYQGNSFQDLGQITHFEPGRHIGVFTVVFDGSNLVWSLNGHTCTASGRNEACDNASPATGWIDVGGGSNGPSHISKAVTHSDNTTLVIEYQVPGFQVAEKTEGSTAYQGISIPKTSRTEEIGKPELPLLKEFVVLPGGAHASVEIVSETHTDIPGYLVWPAQESPIDLEGVPVPPFTIDATTYATDQFYPAQIADIGNVRFLRGLPNSELKVIPFQFNPFTGILRVYTSLTIRVSFIHTDNPEPSAPIDEMAVRIGSNLAINPDAIDVYDAPAGLYDDYHLLIITDTTFLPAAEKLASWKRCKGIATRIVTTDSTGRDSVWTGRDTTSIQNFIQNAYDSTSNPKLEAVLFFGDVEMIPVYLQFDNLIWDDIGTDYPYTLLSGVDDIPDINIGRIPVDSLTEAFWVVDKILKYETEAPVDSSYFNSISFAGYFQCNDRRGWPASCVQGEEFRGYLETIENIAQYLEDSLSYSCDRFYTKGVANPTVFRSGAPVPAHLDTSVYSWDSDNHDVANAINTGRFLVMHRDHGYYNLWADPLFTNQDIDTLLTNVSLPVVFSINCQTGWFDNEVNAHSNATFTSDYLCFAEQFLRMENRGCSGIIAATRNSPTFRNNDLANSMFDAIWPNLNTGSGSATAINGLGDILTTAKVAVNSSDEYRLFHVLGDPTMELWTQYPSSMDVYHNSVAWIGDSKLEFEVSEPDAQIILVIGDEIVARKMSSASLDTTVINLSGILDTSTVIEVGVTKPGFRPYRSRITVLPSFQTVRNCNGEEDNSGIAVGAAVINNTADIDPSDNVVSTTCSDLLAYSTGKWGSAATPVNPENLQFLLEHFTGDGVIDDSVTIDTTAVGGKYNWTLFQNEDIDSMLFDIAYWQYSVGLGTPVPLKGDYRHWATVIASTASFPLNDRTNIKIKGFWIDDPSSPAGLNKTFVTVDEWTDPAQGIYLVPVPN
jgi:hypothetical protein